MKFSTKVVNWLIIAYCSLILILSVASLNDAQALNNSKVLGLRGDYLLHVLLFIPWMVLTKWRWKDIDSKWFFLSAMGIGILFAGISEAIQAFLPNRTFNLIDLAANSLGIVMGAVLIGIVAKKKIVNRQ